MAQQSNPPSNITNIWIQDANGQPQMIKVIHATPAKGVPIPVSGGAVRAVLKTTSLDGAAIVRSLPQGTVLSPQVLQTLVKNPRTPGPKPIAGQLVAIPLTSTSNGSSSTPTSGSKTPAVQFLSPVVLSTPQRPSQQQPQRPNQQQPQQPQQQTPQVKNFVSPILDHSGSRKRQDVELEQGPDSKRRRMEKGSKGLRHFSMKVCEKVRKKGITSYNEVADELVAEFSDPNRCSSPADQYDQKNIRRRVYDALNVLMAMNIISKEKKEIKWLGLPSNSLQELQTLEQEKQRRIERIKQKTQQLHELILQQIAFKSLVQRNKQLEKTNHVPSSASIIQLPFLVINTNKKTVIDCSISSDKMEYLFTFDDTFEIHDDIEVLKRMGLALGLDKAQSSEEDIRKAKSYVPKALEHYVDQLAHGSDDDFIPESMIPISHIKLEAIDPDTPDGMAIRAGAVTPSMSVSTGFSDSEDDHDDDQDGDDNSDVDIN